MNDSVEALIVIVFRVKLFEYFDLGLLPPFERGPFAMTANLLYALEPTELTSCKEIPDANEQHVGKH